MDERSVVTCFLRHGTEVLLVRRSNAVGFYREQWGGVSGYAEGTPGAAARREIDEEVGLLEAVEFVRSADAFEMEDEDRGTRWLVHPFLFDCSSTAVDPNKEIADHEWVQPPEILDRATVPRLWDTYRAVAPTIGTATDDDEHGSAYLSVRALEVLRDAAADAEASGGDDLAGLAADLRAARPSMGVVRNRINRVMADADSPGAVRERASAACRRALAADSEAAAEAARRIGDRVLTISRSGTVLGALRQADPETVYVAESRPKREGVGVAEDLADEVDVLLFVDAAVAHVLATEPVDAVLVGADSVLADGRVVNKVGTRPAALAADAAGVDCYAVCAKDKIVPEADVALESGPAGEVHGSEGVEVLNPTFEVTPSRLFDGLLTEEGALSTAEVAAVADEHAALAERAERSE
ncbi:initiation factor 2B [Halobacteriales archaeon QS_9_68_42]|nr:MAG: initiation factor 2B [Halobacteriales archaeon QS_9_68_42]